MFNQFTSIVDRNFVVGFYVPSLIFMVVSLAFNKPGARSLQWLVDTKLELDKATVFAMVTLFVGLILQAFTRPIYRVLEGYWYWGLQRLLRAPQIHRYRQLLRRHAKLESDSRKNQFSPAKQRKYNEISLKLVQQFPSREELILPTALGNTLRAFEEYPSRVYGFDGIAGWDRLSAVIPKEFMESIRNSQAPCDMWVNFVVIGVMLAIESVVVLHARSRIVVPVLCLAGAWLSLYQARVAAVLWGSAVKGAFDTFLPELAKKLGYQLPQTTKEAHEFWKTYSAIMIFRRDDLLPQLEKYRAKPGSDDPAKSS